MIEVKFSGALKRSFPRINAGAPTVVASDPFAKEAEGWGYAASTLRFLAAIGVLRLLAALVAQDDRQIDLTPRSASCFASPSTRRGGMLPAELRADRWRPASIRPWFPRPRPRPVRADTPRRRRPAECCWASVPSRPRSCRSGCRRCHQLPCRDCRWD